MSRSKPPRKAYRPRPVTDDTMMVAKHFAAKPSAADQAEVLGLLASAIKALREGVATEHQWSTAAGSVAVALAIERRGIVRGMHGHFKLAEEALQAIYDRALRTGGGRWVRVPLYFYERDALDDLLVFHTFQVQQLGRAELLAAIDAAHKDTIAQGHTVSLVHNAERMAA